MNVLFDHQVFSFQEYGGISRYYSQLIKSFAHGNEVHTDLLIKYSNNSFLTDLSIRTPQPFFSSHRFKGRNEIIRLLNQSYFKKNYPTLIQPDIFHPTYYHPYFLNIIGDIPFVLTIYDMAHEHYPHLFHSFDFTIKNKKILAVKAARIIAISNYTKNDVVRILGVPESKIDVIPLATNIFLNGSLLPAVLLQKQYILYVGARNTYKNFLFFLRAVKSIINDTNKFYIVCAGGGKFTANELNEISRLNLSNKIIQMNVTDEILAVLYSNAKAFVYPSLYEGFGITVLEALTCGAPAVLSNRSSLPEVGGDAALYFDPEQSESLEQVLRIVLTKNDVSEEMRVKGFERAKLFSWKKTGEKTIETYKKILRKH
jgi:glycosyltransferase involved in cell wall biosynthesis